MTTEQQPVQPEPEKKGEETPPASEPAAEPPKQEEPPKEALAFDIFTRPTKADPDTEAQCVMQDIKTFLLIGVTTRVDDKGKTVPRFMFIGQHKPSEVGMFRQAIDAFVHSIEEKKRKSAGGVALPPGAGKLMLPGMPGFSGQRQRFTPPPGKGRRRGR